MRHVFRLFHLVLILLIVTIAGGAQAQDEAPAEPRPIRVWWPEALYDPPGQDMLDTLFADFNDSSTFTVDYRVYLSNFDGQGPTDQLNLTYTVAPNAMPDIMVIRRDHMIALAQGLSASTAATDEDPTFAIQPAPIQNLENWNIRPLLNDIVTLSPALQQFGEVNGVLYGIPYFIDVQHMVASPDVFTTVPIAFEDVIATETPMLFPGRPRSGRVVNDVVLMLYLAAGGRLTDDNGLPTLNEQALRQSLNLVNEALQNDVFSEEVLSYRIPEDYLPDLTTADNAFGLVDSSIFLSTFALESYDVLPVPTNATAPLVFVDGWVWILLTDDIDRQQQAREFTGFMMETDRLIDVSTAMQTLPIQERALNAIDTDYIETIQTLLAQTTFVAGRRNQAAVALQAAFESILNGVSPNEAATIALESLTPNTTGN